METKINYNKKYLKYKLKYNKLKGGAIMDSSNIYCHYVGDEAVFFNDSHPYKFPGYIEPTKGKYTNPELPEEETPLYKDQYGYEYTDKLVYHDIFTQILENCYQKYKTYETKPTDILYVKPDNRDDVQCEYRIYSYHDIEGVYFIKYNLLTLLGTILLDNNDNPIISSYPNSKKKCILILTNKETKYSKILAFVLKYEQNKQSIVPYPDDFTIHILQEELFGKTINISSVTDITYGLLGFYRDLKQIHDNMISDLHNIVLKNVSREVEPYISGIIKKIQKYNITRKININEEIDKLDIKSKYAEKIKETIKTALSTIIILYITDIKREQKNIVQTLILAELIDRIEYYDDNPNEYLDIYEIQNYIINYILSLKINYKFDKKYDNKLDNKLDNLQKEALEKVNKYTEEYKLIQKSRPSMLRSFRKYLGF